MYPKNKNKSKNKRWRKKGFELTTPVIVSLIIGFLVLFVLFGGVNYVKKGINLLGINIGEATQDCDSDRIEGDNDACPCTFGTISQVYGGCPEGKKTADFSKEDIITCSQYVSVKNPGTFVSKCDAEDINECVTKCDAVKEGIKIMPEEKGKEGRKGEWDFYFKELKVFGIKGGNRGNTGVTSSGQKPAQLRIDLDGDEFAKIGLEYQLFNKGQEEFVETVRMAVEVCDINKIGCREIESAAGEYNWNSFPDTFRKEIEIGADGDYCDGQGTKSCYVKITIDKNKDGSGTLAETNENNNDVWIFLVLEKQTLKQFGFTKKRAIELLINDESSADPEDKMIFQTCEEYIGDVKDSDGFKCDSLGISSARGICDSDEYPSERGTELSAPFDNKGCLVVVAERDYSRYDCGYAGANESVIIDVNTFRKIAPLKTPFINSRGNDAGNAMEYSWKALPNEGSLICSDDFWLLCDSNSEDQMLRIGETDYLCRSKIWSKR